MSGVSLPLADPDYFPGGGNSVTFLTPPGIEGIAGRMAYSSPSGLFSMIWDQAYTTEVPARLGQAMCNLTTPIWPHTFVVPRYATMVEYKQYPPANHLHMTWNLPVARLQHRVQAVPAGQSPAHDLESAGRTSAALDGFDRRAQRHPMGRPAEVHRGRR
ncbi:MAG: hypothetical protein ACYS4W_12180, partial [Planctomycetota bacterium]|jgi:hypothetical protein